MEDKEKQEENEESIIQALDIIFDALDRLEEKVDQLIQKDESVHKMIDE